jgi:hypothetical protein
MQNVTAQQSVAQIILAQLGGGRFIAMTGAKQLGDHGNGLSFKLPARFAKQGINFVKITLTPADLYDIEFGTIRGLNYTVKATVEGIYCDMLREIFTDKTGLETSLGRVA